MINIYD